MDAGLIGAGGTRVLAAAEHKRLVAAVLGGVINLLPEAGEVVDGRVGQRLPRKRVGEACVRIIAKRPSEFDHRRTDDVVEVNLPELIRSLGDRVPWRLIVIGGAALLALFAAQGEAASWDIYLKALKGVPFGLKEPAQV